MSKKLSQISISLIVIAFMCRMKNGNTISSITKGVFVLMNHSKLLYLTSSEEGHCMLQSLIPFRPALTSLDHVWTRGRRAVQRSTGANLLLAELVVRYTQSWK